MSHYFSKLALIVFALLLISNDAFAQRGGRNAQGKADEGLAEPENKPQAGRSDRQGGGAMETESASGSPPVARGRRGQAGGQTGRFGAGAAGATNPLFAALDADGDGVITRAEMENAIVAFARLDEDKDGKLSKEEAGANGGGSMGGRGGARGAGSGQAGGSQSGRGRMQAPENNGESGLKKEIEPPANSKSGSPFDKK